MYQTGVGMQKCKLYAGARGKKRHPGADGNAHFRTMYRIKMVGIWKESRLWGRLWSRKFMKKTGNVEMEARIDDGVLVSRVEIMDDGGSLQKNGEFPAVVKSH